MKRWYQGQGVLGGGRGLFIILTTCFFSLCVCLFLLDGNLSMFVKWREMSGDISEEHTEVKYKGNNQQSKIPGEAGGHEIKETSDKAEGCLFP